MSITLVTGRPGAGKSYFAVKMLRDDFFEFDKEFDQYKPIKNKENGRVYTIVTNIENLNLQHLPLNYLVDLYSGGDVLEFFTIKTQDKLHERFKNVVYILDECQQYFRYLTPKNDEKTFFYFEKHRHYGDTFFLLSQDSWRISKYLVALADKEIRAVSRAKTLTNNHMCYRELSGGTLTGLKHRKKDKTVFELYKSMDQSEAVKPSGGKLLLKLLIPFAFFGLSMFFLLQNFGQSVTAEENKSISNQKQEYKNQSQNISYKEPEKKYPKRNLSYIQKGDLFLIHNPCTNELIPLQFIDFEISYRESFTGKSIIFTGRPPCQLEKKESDEAEASEDFTEYASY